MEKFKLNAGKQLVFRAEGFGDLADFAKESAVPTESSSTKKDKYSDFHSTKDMNDAVNLLVEGWDAHMEDIEDVRNQVRQRIGSLDTATFSYENGLVGQFLDVDAYMQGDPYCMLNAVEDTTKRAIKFVRILVDVSFSAMVSSKDIATRGGAIVALCDVLNLMGYSTEVWVNTSICSEYQRTSSSSDMTVLVPVQRAGQPWDVRSASFPLACGDLLRRLTFGIMEGLTSSQRDTFGVGSGYGYPGASSKGSLADEHCGGADIICQTKIGDMREVVADPVGWVLKQCSNLGILSDAEMASL